MGKSKAYGNDKVIELLGKIYQSEVSGITRYLHYSFMIMGHNRIPIQKWFRDNASEATTHATTIGEKITSLGGHPPILGTPVMENNLHTVQQLLEESLKFEEEALSLYIQLSGVAAEVGDIALEEMARGFVLEEQDHIDEVQKMLSKPG